MTDKFKMEFDPGTIKHLGLHMYSTLPPVIAELVANAWDAGAANVSVALPEGRALNDQDEIVVVDDGDGMTDQGIRDNYLVVGRDRRKEEGVDERDNPKRRIMGRKGIGKFAGFGIAQEVEIESVRDGETSRFIMDYAALETAPERVVEFDPLPASGDLTHGTRIVLRKITKYRSRKIAIPMIRRGLARRFSVIHKDFIVSVNGEAITPEERDLKLLLENDADGNPYLWEFEDEEVKAGTGWTVTGWIGALNRTDKIADGIQRGISILARGKLVQEPFVFDATVGQQFALSYLVGELHAEFVDEAEDTVGTARNSLVWDTEANAAFHEWGEMQVAKIAREWAERRRRDNEKALQKNPTYQRFIEQAKDIGNERAMKVADKLIRQVVRRDVVTGDEDAPEVVELCLNYIEFDAFWELAEELTDAPLEDTGKLAKLFREWEVVEAKEMAKVTRGRITTIEKLQRLIDENALEVPTLHNFLKEFPWVLDPRWQLVADEVRYSKLLREEFPEADDIPESDRRIDFLCVRESDTLVVVEIKRPHSVVSLKALQQVEEYVHFLRDHLERTTDDEYRPRKAVGYLLCGDVVNKWQARQKVDAMAKDTIFVRRFADLLGLVQNSHRDFLDRYDALRKVRQAPVGESGETDTAESDPAEADAVGPDDPAL